AVVWTIARRSSRETSLPFFASLFVAIDPILVFQSGQIMTETIFTTLLLLAILPWLTGESPSKPIAAASGLAVGFAFLTRPSMAPIFAALGFVLLFRRDWPGIQRWILTALVAFAVALPWALNNKIRWDQVVFTTTHGGYTLWLANNPSFYEVEVAGGRNWAGSSEF